MNISGVGGPITTDANGNIVIPKNVSSVNGKPTGTGDINGFSVTRITAARVYVGIDIPSVLIYQSISTLDVQWYLATMYMVVVQAATGGTLKGQFQYRDAAQLQTVDVIGGSAGSPLDITHVGNHAYGDVCVPIHGVNNEGIFFYLLGSGVTGSPQVNVYFLVEEK